MASNMVRITGMNSGLDTESIISAYTSTASRRVQKAKDNLTKNKWTQDAWKDINTKIYGFYSKTLSTNRLSSAYSKKKITTSNSALSVVAGDSSVDGVQTAKIKSTASAAYLTGSEINADKGGKTALKDLGIAEGEEITLTDGSGKTSTIKIGGEAEDGKTVVNTLDDLSNALKKSGLNANFDSANGRFFLSAKKTGEGNDFSLGGSVDALAKLGLATNDQLTGAGLDGGSYKAANKIDASSAVLELNGATFKSDTNTFNINGATYTINHMPTDPNEQISVTTAVDYDGVYDVVKDMIKGYNELVNEMSKLYNADSAKGYNPLTDEQKELMSEKEITDWEDKIKGSLLKGNDTLFEVMNALTNTTSNGFEIGGKKMYLSDFGVATAGYFDSEANERYALHIDGDDDNENAASKENKLKSMIASDPDGTAQFFAKLSQEMYNNLYSKMGSTSLSSIYKVYNDKQLKTEQTDWEKKIVEYEDKLTEMEDRYYKKFGSMEKMLAKINASQSSVGSFFG